MAPEYFGNALTPGVVYFHCDRMLAALSVPGCATMWRSENKGQEGAHEACHRCPVGAAHAGENLSAMSPFHGLLLCSRCHNWRESPKEPDKGWQTAVHRLIGGQLCVSCYNREREFLAGRNAKGTALVKLRCLARRRLRYMAGSTPCVVSRQLTLNIDELVVSALRDSTARVRIGFGAFQPPALRQGRLF